MPAADISTTIQKHTLGQTRVSIKLVARGDHRQAMLRMVTQSRRTIDIVSRHLDSLIFNERDMVDAFKNLALKTAT